MEHTSQPQFRAGRFICIQSRLSSEHNERSQTVRLYSLVEVGSCVAHFGFSSIGGPARRPSCPPWTPVRCTRRQSEGRHPAITTTTSLGSCSDEVATLQAQKGNDSPIALKISLAPLPPLVLGCSCPSNSGEQWCPSPRAANEAC
jgi:hypothetical protein